MNILIIILLAVAAYLIGSFSSALWYGKWFYGIDIREHGSGNLGATNTFRTLGKTAGIIVTVIDILKGTAAVLLPLIPYFQDTSLHPLLLGGIAVLGHMYPIFAGFRGGKAVATSAGVLLGYAWPLFAILVCSFLISLKLTKMVSLTSIIASTIALIYAIINVFINGEWELLLLIAILATFIVYRHRENIKRIKNGTEPKIKW